MLLFEGPQSETDKRCNTMQDTAQRILQSDIYVLRVRTRRKPSMPHGPRKNCAGPGHAQVSSPSQVQLPFEGTGLIPRAAFYRELSRHRWSRDVIAM